MKKGFTLIELLAVLVILVIIMAIATPIILGIIDEAQKSADKAEVELILESANNYYAIKSLDSKNFDSDENIYSELSLSNDKPENGAVKINNNGEVYLAVYINGVCYTKNFDEKKVKEDYTIENALDCAPKIDYVDASLNGGDVILKQGLIPVIIDATGTVTVADTTKEWYNYDNKQWANAISVTSEYRNAPANTVIAEENILAYFVYIPRYEYQIFDIDTTTDLGEEQEIKIKFVSNEVETVEGNQIGDWQTHPAFTHDNQNLEGVWVGKFELTGTNTNPTIKPNENTMSNQTVIEFLDITKIFTNSNEYGLTTGESRMINNAEWGAVAYLSHSKHGIGKEIVTNNNYSGESTNISLSGCGTKYDNNTVSPSTICENEYGSISSNVYPQSTTGNISGIFDMVGSRVEYVAANYKYIQGNYGSVDFTSENYFNMYETFDFNSTKGHAMIETMNWYDDYVIFPIISNPYVLRGEHFAGGQKNHGIFFLHYAAGNANRYHGSRAVYTVN